jgi:prevent-host-death family protein
MMTINVKDARSQLKALLDRVAGGEEVVLKRHGKVVARLVPPSRKAKRLPSLKAFRASISLKGLSLSETVIKNRADARF